MTSEGLGEVLKVTLQTRVPENFRSCRWGDERTVKRAQKVSEDPHRRERKLYNACQIHSFAVFTDNYSSAFAKPPLKYRPQLELEANFGPS
jgi:hypothetical protein